MKENSFWFWKKMVLYGKLVRSSTKNTAMTVDILELYEILTFGLIGLNKLHGE